jgi:hypothetical protein
MTTIIHKDALKRELLKACITKQNVLIGDFKNRIHELLFAHRLGNEEAHDNSELSQSSQKTNEINSLNKELEFANQELEILKWLEIQEPKENAMAELGAIVITNHGSFFISASLEEIAVVGIHFLGISVHSPFFIAMKGKRKGDRFSFNEKSYKIDDIL